ncbi:MAG: hypothetical protein J0I65_27090 [Variovorax sp.]|nr:hypothetical protein [Variovorax sp.]|tara:strand:- start:893 stop:1285 length:393 start_codon:yes stop_codon:yes gene_type:complete
MSTVPPQRKKAEKKPLEIGLLEGIEPHPQDAEVVKAIASAKRKPGGSSDSVVAFKNMSGKVYRRAVLNGIHQEMQLADRLEALGIADESEFGGRRPKGVWVCFGPKRDMTLEGVLKELKTGVRPLAKLSK